MAGGISWTDEETEELARAYLDRPFGMSTNDYALLYTKRSRHSYNGIRIKLQYLIRDGVIKEPILESPYIQYNKPLEVEGDALILCDLEAPFQHSQFVNRCLEVAEKWNIRQVILAGDAVHFDALSQHAPSWKPSEGDNGRLDRDTLGELYDVAQSMTGKAKKILEDKLQKMGERFEVDDPDKEMAVARGVLHRLGDQFDKVIWALGNHEGRALAQAQRQLAPDVLLDSFQLKEGKWQIAPYYYALLTSGGQSWRITHPVPLAEKAAKDFSAMHQANIIMAHSHCYSKHVDISGKFIAIQPGCCVDESRLAYAAQRDRTTRTHFLGACIVRDGYLTELNRFTDWEKL